MIGLIFLIYILYKSKKYQNNRFTLIIITLILYILFIFLYQASILIQYNTLTIGSDEARYFNIIYDTNILKDNLFFPQTTSNTVYFWINYVYRTFSVSDFVSILLLRLTNSFVYIASYVVVIDIISLIIKKVPRLTILDILFLFLPSALYMFSRNVRDVYILFLTLFIFKQALLIGIRRYKLTNIVFFIFGLILLLAFRSGFVILLIAIIILFFTFVNKKDNTLSFSVKKILIFLIITLIFLFVFEPYLRNVLLVSSSYGFSLEERSIIYQSSNLDLILLLSRKMISNIPYFVLEPSLVNSIKFYSENDLSIYYMPVDYFLMIMYSIMNQFIIFPIGAIAIFHILTPKYKKIKLFKLVILVFLILITIIYSSSIGSPDIRTKNFFLVPLYILIWVTYMNNEKIDRSQYILLFIVINLFLIAVGLYF